MFSFDKFCSLMKIKQMWFGDLIKQTQYRLYYWELSSCVRLVMMAKAAVFHTANHLKELLINTHAHKHNSFHLPVNLYNHIQTTWILLLALERNRCLWWLKQIISFHCQLTWKSLFCILSLLFYWLCCIWINGCFCCSLGNCLLDIL